MNESWDTNRKKNCGKDRKVLEDFFVVKRNRTALVCSLRMEIEVLAIAPSHKRAARDKRERAYNGIDEAIILRANEHYCQRDVDKNSRANHEIPRGCRSQSGPARLESGKNRTGSIDRLAVDR